MKIFGFCDFLHFSTDVLDFLTTFFGFLDIFWGFLNIFWGMSQMSLKGLRESESAQEVQAQ